MKFINFNFTSEKFHLAFVNFHLIFNKDLYEFENVRIPNEILQNLIILQRYLQKAALPPKMRDMW